jgi:F-type H+-transporting ATPase subunit epsilon
VADSLTVRVVSPETTVFEGEARSVQAPSWDGLIGVLKGHAPLMTLLGAGELTLDMTEGGSEVYYIAGGFMQVENDEILVLAEYAGKEPPPEGLPPGAVYHPDEDEELYSMPGNPLA